MKTTLQEQSLLFPVFFIALWLVVGFLLSRLGWNGFARRYPSCVRPPGRSFNCRSAWFGTIIASYRNVMRVAFSDAGIYIYPLILFRAFHSPFLVPWEKVVGVTRKKMLFTTYDELEVRDSVDEIHILLSDEALREFQKFKRAELTATDNSDLRSSRLS